MTNARIDWWVGDLLTGKLRYRVPVLTPTWSLVMDEAGALGATLPMADDDVASLNPYVTAAPGKSYLACCYIDDQGSEHWLQGGPIWTHAWDDAAQTLQLGAAGMWSYFDHRKLMRVLASSDNPALVAALYSGLSLGTIAKRLVQLAQTYIGGNVPVVLPDDEPGSANRVYPGYELVDIGPALKELSQVDGGPEIQFVPRRQAGRPGYLEWVMRIGTVADPLLVQDGDDWSWDQSAAAGSVIGLNVNRDGTATGSRAWSVGAGDAEAKLISRADSTTLLAAGYPLLEVDEARDGVEIRATLDGFATTLLARSARPVEAWTMNVRRDGDGRDGDDLEIPSPNLGGIGVGHWARLRVGGHRYLPAGDYRTRITQISGDNGPTVAVQLQPTNAGGLVTDGG